MVYISIAGKQVMAILNPILAFLDEAERNNDKIAVHLLTTEATDSIGKKIEQYLLDHYSKHVTVKCYYISSKSIELNNRPPAFQKVTEIITQHDNQLITFNLAGGLNFQIVSCLYTVPLNNIIFLYPESKCIHAFHYREEKLISHNQMKVSIQLPIRDILELQGVLYEEKINHNNQHYNKRLKNIVVPLERLDNISVSGVSFEQVYNKDNELRFLKIILDTKQSGKELLTEVRMLIGLALQRKEFGELFHRSIAVLSNSSSVRERIEKEANKKITVFKINKKQFPHQALVDFFIGNSQAQRPNYHDIQEQNGNKTKRANSSLFVVLGEDILPTLIAIWSHRSTDVHILYTPNNLTISHHVGMIQKLKFLLPLESISFYPVSISGNEIMEFKKTDSFSIAVNITPGTKSQGSFLALWARVNNAEVFSIENTSGLLKQIPIGKVIKLNAPDILTLFRLSGMKIMSEGDGKNTLLSDVKKCETIKSFLLLMDQENTSIKNFLKTNIKLSTMKCTIHNDRSVWIHTEGTKVQVTSDLNDGSWFERMIGNVLLDCGADDVRIRLRSDWSESAKHWIYDKYGSDTPMTDIDVAARFGSRYYIFEAKAGKVSGITKAVKDLKARASLFGRFAIPIFVKLKYQGEPILVDNVYEIGYKTLISKITMIDFLQTALKQRQTT